VSAYELCCPAAMRTTAAPWNAATGVGLERSLESPVPSCPKLLLPHAYSVPSAPSASACA
jgi:hypothetical protein